ncbi:MAG: hypothetical protein M0Q12_07800, partial [Synergistaceae bacterium]|nr:hypothetical protein [Synergistaceae bacterium]
MWFLRGITFKENYPPAPSSTMSKASSPQTSPTADFKINPIMKFFIDTANLSQIREARDLGILDGVTTNPSLMARENIYFTV